MPDPDLLQGQQVRIHAGACSFKATQASLQVCRAGGHILLCGQQTWTRAAPCHQLSLYASTDWLLTCSALVAVSRDDSSVVMPRHLSGFRVRVYTRHLLGLCTKEPWN